MKEEARQTKDGRVYVAVNLPRDVFDALERRRAVEERSRSAQMVCLLKRSLGMVADGGGAR